MGNKGVITPGAVQWMTAGSGIIHLEMPKESPSGMMWGFQFWANLPTKQKMMPPRYREVKAADIPEVTLASGVVIKIICGEVAEVRGPVRDIVIDPEMLDISIPAGITLSHPVKVGHTAVAYILDGEGCFDHRRDTFAYEMVGSGWMNVTRRCLCGPETAVLYERDGKEVTITAGDRPLRFLFVSGMPLHEPVAWYGPIVMNTQEELRVAFDEYAKGTFVKHP